MTVNAITDTKKGRTGIAPTYLHTTPNVYWKNSIGLFDYADFLQSAESNTEFFCMLRHPPEPLVHQDVT